MTSPPSVVWLQRRWSCSSNLPSSHSGATSTLDDGRRLPSVRHTKVWRIGAASTGRRWPEGGSAPWRSSTGRRSWVLPWPLWPHVCSTRRVLVATSRDTSVPARCSPRPSRATSLTGSDSAHCQRGLSCSRLSRRPVVPLTCVWTAARAAASRTKKALLPTHTVCSRAQRGCVSGWGSSSNGKCSSGARSVGGTAPWRSFTKTPVERRQGLPSPSGTSLQLRAGTGWK
mmetsp:Transcript_82787/g.208432  ORF Transcript_82787/g.208432 Transcript_82787/m.208432 type:complete len:228 (+) Transcript_82787:806-1489(+)